MKRILVVVLYMVVICNIASADTFGAGENQFIINFVTISGDASSANGTNICQFQPLDIGYKTFTDPSSDYRIGIYEITNNQWTKFINIYGTPYGDPPIAYDSNGVFMNPNVPTNGASWYEAAQFVNWLNMDAGYDPAYKFSGTQGTSNYSLEVWQPEDIGYDSNNPYRNSNAYYFLPTEDEWVKAAYWNGTNLQTYATIDDTVPVAGVDTNNKGEVGEPWDVGSGSKELNGTFDMMGNVWEWMESPWDSNYYEAASRRGIRGGSFDWYSFGYDNIYLSSSCRWQYYKEAPQPYLDMDLVGFRVASKVPEPCTLSLMFFGGIALLRRRR